MILLIFATTIQINCASFVPFIIYIGIKTVDTLPNKNSKKCKSIQMGNHIKQNVSSNKKIGKIFKLNLENLIENILLPYLKIAPIH